MKKGVSLLALFVLLPSVIALGGSDTFTASVGLQPTTTVSGSTSTLENSGIGTPKYFCRKINQSYYDEAERCVQYNSTCQLPQPVEHLNKCTVKRSSPTITIITINPSESKQEPTAVQSPPAIQPPSPQPPQESDFAVPTQIEEPVVVQDAGPPIHPASSFDPILLLLVALICLVLYWIYHQWKEEKEQNAK